jgi:hypothetical protein
MANKILTERLNHELDAIGVPQTANERMQACAKIFELPRFKVHALLSGNNTIDANSIEKVAGILEVKTEWLLGINATKH